MLANVVLGTRSSHRDQMPMLACVLLGTRGKNQLLLAATGASREDVPLVRKYLRSRLAGAAALFHLA